MPHNYQFYLDYKANEERLNIEHCCKKIKVPHLIIHAEDDPSVKFEEAINLHKWNPNSNLLKLENSNHVFDSKHPWEEKELPIALQQVLKETICFIT